MSSSKRSSTHRKSSGVPPSPVQVVALTPTKSALHDLGINQRIEQLAKNILEWHDKWLAAHQRGLSLCQSIEAIKRKTFHASRDQQHDDAQLAAKSGNYPGELKKFCDNLATITTIFEDIINNVRHAIKQLRGYRNLGKDELIVVFKTWNINEIIVAIETILAMYEKEYEMKLIVMENIAHSQSEYDAVLHTSVWEYPQFVNGDLEVHLKTLELEVLR